MYYYILNPAAGGGRINKIQQKLQSLIRQRRIDGEFVKSLGKGDASKIAEMAIKKGFKTIVAVGGDSTVSEVANGIIGNDDVSLGMIPIGTTNILSKVLGINSWVEGVEILAQRIVRNIEVCKVNNAFFLTSLELGFETEILKERKDSFFFNNFLLKKKVLEKILKYKPFKATLKFDDNFQVTSNIFNLSIYNPRILKNRKNSSELEKNIISILVPYIPKVALVRNSNKIVNANYGDIPYISKLQAKRILIETEKPQAVFADAEKIGMTPIEVSVSSKKINIIVNKNKI